MLAHFPTGFLPDMVKWQGHGGKPTCRNGGRDGEAAGIGAMNAEPWVVLACYVDSLGFCVMSKEDLDKVWSFCMTYGYQGGICKVMVSKGVAKQSSLTTDTKAPQLLPPPCIDPKFHTVGSRVFSLVCEISRHMKTCFPSVCV